MRTPLQTRGMLLPHNTGLGTSAPAQRPTMLSPQAATRSQLDPMQEGSWTSQSFNSQRFVLAGGQLGSDILHPTAIPFEQLYRRLPEEGMFSESVTPSNPFVFELGAFTVPTNMALMIFDLRPDIYRFSGANSGDFLPIESRRFASIMGFDITIDQKRQGNTYFQLDPVPIQRTSQQAFENNNLNNPSFNAGQFEIGRSDKFAASSGASTALLPQRPERFGALSIPFTLFAYSNQTVQVRCVIFKPIPSPIAFIEYDIAGILVPQPWVKKMIEAVKPPIPHGEEEHK